MQFVTIEEVRLQCKADAADDAMLIICANGAEKAAVGFLNRNVYLDNAALTAALAAVDLSGTHSAYEDAIEAADALDSDLDKQYAIDKANITLHNAQLSASMVNDGMVISEDIKSAILLIAAFQYRNRDSSPVKNGDQIDVPPHAQWLMRPYVKIGPL